ncbi:MAG: IS1595 family transposase [Candidatus Aenigmarchaeota archaeon]|nr:IS1595 family transposase [Candidatus Aenigmarchaeota archaeon]
MHKLRRDLEILYYFYIEVSALKAAKELSVPYRTVHARYMDFRMSIMAHLDQEFVKLAGQLELDETYFGGKRKGKRGRGAFNKAIVFGILERNGKVYTKVVINVKAKTLMGEIKKKSVKGSVFYTDYFKSYKSLKQFGKHNKINHGYTFGKSHNHINGIEGFWSYAKERFHKYHGINMVNYPFYLKEMEFRFNHRNEDVFKLLVNITKGGNLVRK